MAKYRNGRGRRAVVLGMAAACAVAGGRQQAVAAEIAGSSSNGPSSNGPEATGQAGRSGQPARRLNIPAGPLDAALAAFRQQTGLRVTLTLDAETAAGFQSRGVAGVLAPDEALRVLLAGTGLAVQQTAPDTFAVGLRHAESVDVTTTVPEGTALGRLPEPLLDTPQTVDVVPDFILRDEQNRTLQDAVRNVPGISVAAGEAGAQGDNLTIRGFTARNDIFLDGIRDFGSYYRDDFNINQVEVLEGPAGVQFGRGSTGGVINQESKLPQAGTQAVVVNAVVGTDLTRRLTADINEPIGDPAAGIAFRANAMGTDGGVAGRPFADNRRFGLAPSISVGLGKSTSATLSYFHFTENDTPDYGLPWFENHLAPGVDRHAYYGFGDTNFLKTNDDIVTLRANHTFRDNVDLHTIGRFANYPRNAQITEPQICSNATFSVPVGGYVNALPTSAVNANQTCPYLTNFNPANVLVNRNQIQIKSVEGDLWDQTELTARFKLLGIRNDFVGGAEGGREVSNPIRTSYSVISPSTGAAAVNTVPSTSLLNPNTGATFSGTGYVSSATHVTSRSAGVYFVDTFKLGRFVELSGGVRWDLFDTYYNAVTYPTPGASSQKNTYTGPLEQKVTQPTYRAAFVFKPNQHGSVYFDYGTSFNPSAESLSLSVSSSVLPPEENETFEVGAKYSLLRERLRVEGAIFQTTKDNARETSPGNSTIIVLAGNQRVRGVQGSAIGQLPHGMDLIAGYAYLSSDVIYSQYFPTSVGYQLANVPKQTFNLFLSRTVARKFNFGFGGNYVAARTASSTTPFVPTAFGPAQTFTPATAPRYCVLPGAATPTSASVTCYPVLATAMKQVPGYWVFNAMLRRPITDHIELQANVYNLLNRFYIDQPHPSHLIPAAGLSALIGANFHF